ncbi:TRAP transporter small permease [Virgibacillus salexigens]|uniref:TRAP transporter small permease n=1 Tax=Virgibacillus salexigens TaxID=61016 RepID=UPI00190B5E51|nr:TRAP transporter small permease [Virgibacillus salexigens]
MRINKLLDHLEEYVAVLSLLIASLLVFLQVVLRYAFNISLVWSEEVSRYIIIWFILVGSSIAVREKAHATVDAVVTYLPYILKRLCSILASVIGMIFSVILIWSGSITVSNVIEFGNVTPAVGIPMFIPYLALPVGGSLMFIRFLQLLIKDATNAKKNNSNGNPPVTEGGTKE